MTVKPIGLNSGLSNSDSRVEKDGKEVKVTQCARCIIERHFSLDCQKTIWPGHRKDCPQDPKNKC